MADPGLVDCPECGYPVLPSQRHCRSCGFHPPKGGLCYHCDTPTQLELPGLERPRQLGMMLEARE